MDGIPSLILSRARHDWRRHCAGALVVAILAATFVAFQSVSAGLDEGLARTLREERSNEFVTPQLNLLDEADLAWLAGLPGVETVVPRAVARTGIPAGFGEVLVVGVDAAREAPLVRLDPGAQGPSPFGVVAAGKEYVLRVGRWLQGPGEALLDEDLAGADSLGRAITLDTPEGPRNYTVVGILVPGHAASIGIPGTVANVVSAGPTLVTGPHVLVGIDDHPFAGRTSARVVSRPDHAAMRAVADALVEAYPDEAHRYVAQIREFERQHFDATQAVVVLRAAGILTGLLGAGTMFGVFLLLLGQEERQLGVLRSLGFTLREVVGYGAGKVLLLAALGAALGIGLGVLLAGAFTPEMGFEFRPALSSAVLLGALARTLAFAGAGAALALLIVLRKEPALALRHSE